MTAIPTEPPLAGWRVGVTADRRADQQADALRRRGAEVVQGCTMRTLDLSDNVRLLEVSRALVDQPPETLVLQTGMGLTMWLDAMDGIEPRRPGPYCTRRLRGSGPWTQGRERCPTGRSGGGVVGTR